MMEFADKTELITALVKAKLAFTEVKKNKINPFFHSEYADLESVNSAVDPALAENGLVMIQPVVSEDGKLYVDTYLLHESGQHIFSRWEVVLSGGSQNRQQTEGAGVTYIRRYAKAAMLGLASESDDDGSATTEQGGERNTNQRQPERQSAPSGGAGDRDRKKCFAIATAMGWNETEIADFFRSHCPVVNKDGGEIMFKTTKSRKEFKPENWKLLAGYLDKMQKNKTQPKPAQGLDALMDEAVKLLGSDSVDLTRWLEVNYIADFDNLDPEKQKPIEVFLGKVIGDATIQAKAVDGVREATDWYNNLGPEAVDEMVHRLAAQSQEVVNLFLEHLSAKNPRHIDKTKFGEWEAVLKKSKAEAGEPEAGVTLV